MKLDLVDRRRQPAPMALEADRLAPLVASLGLPDWLLNLVLVDDAEMTSLNERWYGGEGPTDVLSFSYLEEAGPGAPALASGRHGAARDLWVAPGEAVAGVVAGEVVLAPDYVARRAREGGWDVPTEWALLLVHGTLHVLGWRHDEVADRRAMRDHEASVLRESGFVHPLPSEQSEG